MIYLIVNRQFSQAIERLYLATNEASVPSSSLHPNLALHEACNHQGPAELIELLLQIHPDAVSQKGQWGYLPLHFAVCSRSTTDVAAKLLEVYPDASRHADNNESKLPLHLATKWGANEEAILLLLTVYPQASFIKDATDKTPLDHAMFVAQTSPTESPMADSYDY
jgi:ankyrin repeat protein